MSTFFSKVQVKATSKVQMHQPLAKTGDKRTLEEKFADARRSILNRERRKLREFHFIYLEHAGFLYALRGPDMKIMAKIPFAGERKTLREASDACWKYWSKFEEHEGGIYFDIFVKFKDDEPSQEKEG